MGAATARQETQHARLSAPTRAPVVPQSQLSAAKFAWVGFFVHPGPATLCAVPGVIHFECTKCGATYPADRPQTVCTRDGGILFAHYDLDNLKHHFKTPVLL